MLDAWSAMRSNIGVILATDTTSRRSRSVGRCEARIIEAQTFDLELHPVDHLVLVGQRPGEFAVPLDQGTHCPLHGGFGLFAEQKDAVPQKIKLDVDRALVLSLV